MLSFIVTHAPVQALQSFYKLVSQQKFIPWSRTLLIMSCDIDKTAVCFSKLTSLFHVLCFGVGLRMANVEMTIELTWPLFSSPFRIKLELHRFFFHSQACSYCTYNQLSQVSKSLHRTYTSWWGFLIISEWKKRLGRWVLQTCSPAATGRCTASQAHVLLQTGNLGAQRQQLLAQAPHFTMVGPLSSDRISGISLGLNLGIRGLNWAHFLSLAPIYYDFQVGNKDIARRLHLNISTAFCDLLIQGILKMPYVMMTFWA